MAKLPTWSENLALTMDELKACVAKSAQPFVHPIYRNKGIKPDHWGTGTFIELDGVDYLVTAAHVLDGHGDHTLFVGYGELLPITLVFDATGAPGGDRTADKIDFAFAPVDASWRERGITPLRVDALVQRDDARLYSVFGYPNSSNRRHNPHTLEIKPTSRQYISNPVSDPAAFEDIGLDPSIHLALDRDPKIAMSNGQKVNVFEPRGMSGGVIFGLYGLGSPEVVAGLVEPLIAPAAIITEKNKDYKLLFGTRLSSIVSTIRRERSRLAVDPKLRTDAAPEGE